MPRATRCATSDDAFVITTDGLRIRRNIHQSETELPSDAMQFYATVVVPSQYNGQLGQYSHHST